MAYSSLDPLSDGIFAKLNVVALKGAYPSVGAGCNSVGDFVPQPLTFPFLLYSMKEKDISGLGSGPSVKQIELRLHVFSTFQGMKEAKRIMTAAIGLLQFVSPSATGWQIPAIGRPNDVVEIGNSEINGIVCRELVSIWDDFFACENAA